MEILELLTQSFLKYGAIGLLALVGWAISAWFFYRDSRKKNERDAIVAAKEKEVTEVREKLDTEKDEHRKTSEKLSNCRLEDAKEMIDDYNELATNTTHTIDKLAIALQVKNVR